MTNQKQRPLDNTRFAVHSAGEFSKITFPPGVQILVAETQRRPIPIGNGNHAAKDISDMSFFPQNMRALAEIFNSMADRADQPEKLLIHWWASKHGVHEYEPPFNNSKSVNDHRPGGKAIGDTITDREWFLFLRAHGEALQEAIDGLLDEWWHHRDTGLMEEYDDEWDDETEVEEMPGLAPRGIWLAVDND